MMCYKDITFCYQYSNGYCINHNCPRALTETEKILARDWWGGEGFPYSVGDMKSEVCGFIPGEKNEF